MRLCKLKFMIFEKFGRLLTLRVECSEGCSSEIFATGRTMLAFLSPMNTCPFLLCPVACCSAQTAQDSAPVHHWQLRWPNPAKFHFYKL